MFSPGRCFLEAPVPLAPGPRTPLRKPAERTRKPLTMRSTLAVASSGASAPPRSHLLSPPGRSLSLYNYCRLTMIDHGLKRVRERGAGGSVRHRGARRLVSKVLNVHSLRPEGLNVQPWTLSAVRRPPASRHWHPGPQGLT